MDDMIRIPVRSAFGKFVICVPDGEPPIRINYVGAFARALIRRRLGHDRFWLALM